MSYREVPIGAAFDVRNGATPASGEAAYWDGDIPWVGPADLGRLKTRFVERGERSITAEGYASCGTQMVPSGTIILSIRAPIGHMAIASQSMCFNQGCRGLVPRRIVRSDFAYWALSARRLQLEAAGQGTTFVELARNTLRAERIPLPDLAAQKAIADFLDRKTARIDKLVENKERLTERLDEKRLALITHTIASGLGVSTEQALTHNKFFPEIPIGWQLVRLKDVALHITDGPHISPEYVDEGILFISARNVKVDRWELGDAKFISEAIFKELCRKSKPEIGDLLYTKGGTTGIARVVDLDIDFHIWVHVALIKLRRRLVNPFFLAYALNSSPCYDQSQLLTRGATNNDLGLSRMANICFPLPPLEIQSGITQYLDHATQNIDKLKQEVLLSIHRLREFRSALITDAVTGQLDPASWGEQGQTDRRLDQIEVAMPA